MPLWIKFGKKKIKGMPLWIKFGKKKINNNKRKE